MVGWAPHEKKFLHVFKVILCYTSQYPMLSLRFSDPDIPPAVMSSLKKKLAEMEEIGIIEVVSKPKPIGL